MKITKNQLLTIESSVIEFIKKSSNVFANIEEIEINEEIMVEDKYYSLIETKEYLSERFYYHPIAESELIDDLFSQILLSSFDESLPSREEHNVIVGIQDIIKRRGFHSGLNYVNEALIQFPLCIQLYLIKAEVLKSLNKYEEAIIVYDNAIKVSPQNALLYSQRGAAKADLNRLEEAVEDYSYALKLYSNLPVTLCNRGTLFFKLNKFEKALSDFEAAIKLDSHNARAYFGRGSILFLAFNRINEGLNDIKKAAELGDEEAIQLMLSLNDEQDF